jgi:hypothetical protein
VVLGDFLFEQTNIPFNPNTFNLIQLKNHTVLGASDAILKAVDNNQGHILFYDQTVIRIYTINDKDYTYTHDLKLPSNIENIYFLNQYRDL